MSARLHHELIARTEAIRWLLMTHGILGAGSNWRGIARKLTERRPEWGVVLVDLRQHGRSEPGEPPHDLAACARDVRALIDQRPVAAIAGHSYGGKVVLATRKLSPPGLLQTWVLDATPSPRPEAEADPTNTVTGVLALLERLPSTWARREDFVAAVVAGGQTPALAQWLAMNVAPAPDGQLALRLDLAAIRTMLHDYYAQDLWDAVESTELPGTVEVVIADRSSAIPPMDRARLSAAPPNVHVHNIHAGHWLHIDAPNDVIELFARSLPP